MGITLSALNRIRTLIPLLLLVPLLTLAQEADYYRTEYLRYTNYVYQPNIRTVILEPLNRELTNPVIYLKSNEKLLLKFDDLNEDPGSYSYKFIHCSANWTPSQLSETEYLDGFFTEQISSWRHSVSTRQPYFHYQVEFPTNNMKIKISGNYLLVVFETSDPDKVVLTRRFFVRENNVSIDARIHQATIIDFRYSHQEVDFSLITTLPLRNPYKDLKVHIVQNNRWDIVNKNLKPLFVVDGVMDYNLEEDNIFPGTNEFRFADLRTLQFQTPSMEDIGADSASGLNFVLLKKDQRRATERYSVIDDINGYYLIKIYDNRDGDYEGEYVKARFRLAANEPFDSSNVYVFGQLNDWKLDTLNRMTYSEKERAYVLDLILKQGYYNYHYVVRGTSTRPSTSQTEGDRYEARNEYAFYIYWQDPTLAYDRLVGQAVFYSGL
jgi:hypothetical protein